MYLILFLILGPGEGVFYQGSLENALQKAKSENKLVFVDVYTDWCGPCKLLERTTFKDQAVLELFQTKVVAYRIDAEKGEGPVFANTYKVAGYPSLILLDGDGKVISRKMGYLRPGELLHWINDAQPKP